MSFSHRIVKKSGRKRMGHLSTIWESGAFIDILGAYFWSHKVRVTKLRILGLRCMNEGLQVAQDACSKWRWGVKRSYEYYQESSDILEPGARLKISKARLVSPVVRVNEVFILGEYVAWVRICLSLKVYVVALG